MQITGSDGRQAKRHGKWQMRVVWWLMVAGYLGATLMGFLEFEIWSQVTSLWEREADISNVILHPHGLRYALVLPVFVISDFLDISARWLFSLVVAILIIFISVNVTNTAKILLRSCNRAGLLVIVTVFFMALSGFMHGRIVFALAGMALLLQGMVAWDRRLIGTVALVSRMLLAFFLASVSSGTIVVVIATFYGWWFHDSLRKLSHGKLLIRHWRLTMLFVVLAMLMLPLLSILMEKNIDFYGGGIDGLWNMLTHGAGIVFYMADWIEIVMLLVISFLFTLFLLVLMMSFSTARLPMYAVVISMMGGMFGFSTLAMAIPPLIVLFVLSFERLKSLVFNVYGGINQRSASLYGRGERPESCL